jgi:transcriptional regulator with XRE-family HTH domain
VPSLRDKFGQRLRTIRLARKLSQEQFSELLGISVDFLSLIERGINAPSFENLDVFSAQLNIPLSVLFDFDATLAPHRMNRNTQP